MIYKSTKYVNTPDLITNKKIPKLVSTYTSSLLKIENINYFSTKAKTL